MIEGCPCEETCCDDPDVEIPDHKCSMDDDVDELCEDCYYWFCNNCDTGCFCELPA